MTKLTAFASCIVLPSARGSLNGTPSSMISAPPLSIANISEQVRSGEGNPAVRKATKVGRFCREGVEGDDWINFVLTEDRKYGAHRECVGLEGLSKLFCHNRPIREPSEGSEESAESEESEIARESLNTKQSGTVPKQRGRSEVL